MKGRPNGWRYVGRKEETRLKSNGRLERMENTKYGRRREGQWTPIRAKAQDTKANPNSWGTHLVRKRWDIGLLRALSLWIMMMNLNHARADESLNFKIYWERTFD